MFLFKPVKIIQIQFNPTGKMLTILSLPVLSQQLNGYDVFKKFIKFELKSYNYDTTETIGLSITCCGADELAVSTALC
jgi:hypothetical protein